MKPTFEILNPPAGAVPATLETLAALGVTPSDIEAGEKRFQSIHAGPWSICRSITAIVEETEFNPSPAGITVATRKAFYPARKCSNPRPMGYDMEGTVSLGGKRRHVFTSSQLFELPDGRLVDVATLHLCNR